MTDPIDMDRLRLITGGDRDVEHTIFTMIAETGERCLSILRETNDNDAWTKATHEIRGAAANIGAQAMAAVCKIAEEGGITTKPSSLPELESQWAAMKAFMAAHTDT